MVKDTGSGYSQRKTGTRSVERFTEVDKSRSKGVGVWDLELSVVETCSWGSEGSVILRVKRNGTDICMSFLGA